MRNFQDDEVQHLYDNDQSFKKKIIKSEEQYLKFYKKSKQMGSEMIITESFLEKFPAKSKQSIYFMYGFLLPPPGKFQLKITLNFINLFHPEYQFYQIRPDQDFTFIYFNQSTSSSNSFLQFKNIFLLLPLRIILKMKAFILIKPSMYIKAVNYVGFGSINKYFNRSFTTLENNKQLCNRLGLSIQDFVSFVPEQLGQEFPEKYKQRGSLQNYRVNLFGQNLTESQKKQKNQFEKMINGLITSEVCKLSDYQLGEMGIPIILQILICYFKDKPQGLTLEGIFRKSVSIDEQNQVFEELSKKNYQYIQQITNPHLIASLIKKFFNNLKQPVIGFPQFVELMNDQKITDKKQHIKQIVSKLPKLNLMTLMYLVDFLKKDVITQEKSSKMSLNNIAICFSPCLMRSQVQSNADLIYAGKAVGYTNLLINELNFIFGSEESRNRLFKEKMIAHSKIFQQTIREELKFDQQQEKPGQAEFNQNDYDICSQNHGQSFIMTEMKDPIYPAVIRRPVQKQNNYQQNKLQDKIKKVSNGNHQNSTKFILKQQSIQQKANYSPPTYNITSAEQTTTIVNIEGSDQEFEQCLTYLNNEKDPRRTYIYSSIEQTQQIKDKQNQPDNQQLYKEQFRSQIPASIITQDEVQKKETRE